MGEIRRTYPARWMFIALLTMSAVSACGKPDGSGGNALAPGAPGQPGIAQTLTPSFSSLEAQIFTPKCVKCHNPTKSSGGVDLSSWESVRQVDGAHDHAIVEPGKATESHLYTQIASGNMPPTGTKCSPSEIQAVRDWIDQGALNN